MKTLKFLLLLIVLIVAAAGTYLYLGFYNVGADVPHYAFTERFIDFVKHRSIKARAFKIEVPENLDSPDRLLRGAGNYDAMCVHCHLAPGMGNTEIRQGLYPRPPNLGKHADDPAEQFWVVKHGVRMTGMPAWRKGGVDDEAIWDMVSFLQELPELSEQEYRSLVEASEGHSHEGAEPHEHEMDGENGAPVHHEHEDSHAHEPGHEHEPAETPGAGDETRAEDTSAAEDADETKDSTREMKTISTREHAQDGK